MHQSAIRARVQDIYDELSSKSVSAARVEQLSAEMDRLGVEHRTYQKGASMASFASPSEWGLEDRNPSDSDPIAFKGLVPGGENRVRPTSMYEMDGKQVGALRQAALNGTSFRVQVGSKGIEHGNFSGAVRAKSAITEGGLSPSSLPPIQQLGPQGFWGLPYEITRVANFLPSVAFEAPGVAYFEHTGNAAEAAYTQEGATKPDLTPTITEQYIKPAKVAGRVNLTHELLQDASALNSAFGSTLVTELARSVYNSESNLALNGTIGANGFNGINQVSGTLSTTLTDESPFDTLSRAMVGLRNDFFIPDLIFIHPDTLGALRRYKDLNNRYILDLFAGPGTLDQTAEQETLWGVKTVQTTQQAAGTAAVLSVQSGAAVIYLREALTSFFDPFSQIANNIYQFVAETRFCVACPRPGAINLVSGLPTS